MTNRSDIARQRIEFGESLRALRLHQGLTGTQLASKLGISQSKLSKIETGIVLPSPKDLESLLAELSVPALETAPYIKRSNTLRFDHLSWKLEHRNGLAEKQRQVAMCEEEASDICVFQLSVIPGLLQTPQYARSILTLVNQSGDDDIEAGVASRLLRQHVLFDIRKRFSFVITEQALLSRYLAREIVVEQLKRLSMLFGLHNVEIGFLPARASLPLIPQNSFVILDSRQAVTETLTGELTISEPEEVAQYAAFFQAMKGACLIGDRAYSFLAECMNLISNQIDPSAETLENSDRLKIDYSRDAEKADGLGESATSA